MKEDKDQAAAREPSEMSEREIDVNLEETFPASDPPSWTLGTNHREKSPEQQNEQGSETSTEQESD